MSAFGPNKHAGWVCVLILCIAAAAGGALIGGLIWSTAVWIFD